MIKIALDAGHGGVDPGAVGPTGLEEASINLIICELMAEELKRYNLETKLTRTCDVYVELMQRCHISNDWVADWFVSIHCNSNGPSAQGVETLYRSGAGEALAKPIQEELVRATGDVDRGLKYRSDLAVLNGTDCPATLVEVGFISNPETEKLLRGEPYRKIIADAIVRGIACHLNLTIPSSASKLPPM